MKDLQKENVGCEEEREISKQLKKQFKTFALWKKYTPFVDKNALPEKGPTNSDMVRPPPPIIWAIPERKRHLFIDVFPW